MVRGYRPTADVVAPKNSSMVASTSTSPSPSRSTTTTTTTSTRAQPQARACDVIEREIARTGFVEARRDSAEALEAVEEDFDQVALGVELPVLRDRALSFRLRVDHRLDPPHLHLGAELRSSRSRCRQSRRHRRSRAAPAPQLTRDARRASARRGAVALSRRRSRGSWSKNLLESVPKRSVGSPFPARRILVCADDGSVDDRRYFVDVDLQRSEQVSPRVLPRPIGEAVVDRLPRTKALRKIPPRDACSCSIDDGVYKEPVAARGLSALCTPRQQRLHANPLFVSHSMPVHE